MFNPDSLQAHPHFTPATRTAPRLSVVIPLYNESGALGLLHQRLSAVLDRLQLDSREVVFVDDGSRDSTFDEVVADRLVTKASVQEAVMKAVRADFSS